MARFRGTSGTAEVQGKVTELGTSGARPGKAPSPETGPALQPGAGALPRTTGSQGEKEPKGPWATRCLIAEFYPPNLHHSNPGFA